MQAERAGSTTGVGQSSAPAPSPAFVGGAPGTAFRRVLIAVDQAADAARAFVLGEQVAAACGAEVALVHVIDSRLLITPDGGVAPDVLRADYERSGRALLEATAKRVRSAASVAQFLECGRPAHEIARVAAAWSADLIVVGTRGGSMVAQALLGRTTEGVLVHAHRPVLVVPEVE